jgi:group I intron endonuclease
MFFIYKISNLVNSKLYIGKTNDIYIRWQSHCHEAKLGKRKYPLYLAMNKYGLENFELNVIEQFEDEQDCLIREKFWIEFYKTNICKYGKEFGLNESNQV